MADPVGVGGHEGNAPVQQNAGVLQLLERELRVEAAQKHLRLLPVPGHGDAGSVQLGQEGIRAEHIAGLSRQGLPQIADGGIHGGEIVVPGSLDAHAAELFHVALHAPGGIVGQEQIPAPHGAHMVQEFRYAVEQAVTDVDGAVHVQQKQPLIPQLSHGIVSFAQKYSIRIPQSCRAFKHGGASQGKLFGKRDEKHKKRPPQSAAALSLSKKAMLFGTTGSRETAFHSNYFFRRLSHFTARRVPTVWNSCTSRISRITAANITRYLYR